MHKIYDVICKLEKFLSISFVNMHGTGIGRQQTVQYTNIGVTYQLGCKSCFFSQSHLFVVCMYVVHFIVLKLCGDTVTNQ